MAELAPGSAFAKHVILGLAGSGGMGVVYHARHELLRREVALKVIAPELSADPGFRARFSRESMAAASIRHPNVLPIYDAGEEDGLLYITMHYVDGTDLGRLLAEHGRLAPARAATLIADIAAALDAAHGAGIVHRDVKPANVLLEKHGDSMHPFLTDFGLAKNPYGDTQLTQTGAMLGTVDYAAPEQLEGGDVDPRADVYALGCLLYHVLTGEVPYPAPSPAAKVWAHFSAPPPSVTDIVADAPEQVAEIVRRALDKDPATRYPSAGELGQAALACFGRAEALDEGVTAASEAPRQQADPPLTLAFPGELENESGRGRFVGREDILVRLQRRYELARAGSSQFVVLSGEPGIGKTRLGAQLAREAHADGSTVLYGRSDPESRLPYQPFITAFDHYIAHRRNWDLAAQLEPELSELGRFMPGLRRHLPTLPKPIIGEPEGTRYRLFAAVRRLLALIATERPVVLILDDLHWADTSTALLLRHTVQQDDSVRLLVIGTLRSVESCRSEELADLLARLRTNDSFERADLDGLDAAETAAFVAARGERHASAGFVRRLQHKTDGNPLFIEELLRGLAEAEPSGDVVSEQALSRIGVPDGAKEMIERRLLRLSDSARQALAVASVVGTTFRLDVLERVIPEPAERILLGLEEAEAAGLVRESSDDVDQFSFSHALVREALSSQPSNSRRVRLHHRIGEALEAGGTADPAELARHFFESRRLDGGAKALRYAVQAGDRAAVALAHEEAAAHYRRALELLDMEAERDTRQRCELLLALATVQLRAGDPDARGSFESAAELARREGLPEPLARAALGVGGLYTEAGIVDRGAIALLEEALEALGEGESGLRAMLLARLADSLQFTREEDRAVALSRSALAMAERVGDLNAHVAALESMHTARLHIEHLDERLRLSEELLALAGRIGDRELKALGHHWRVYDLLEAGDVDGARREHRELAELADELRQPLYRHFAIGWEVVWAQMAGQVDAAERLAQESYELGKRAQARDAETVYAAQLLALRRREDRLSEYLATVEQSMREHPALSAWRAVLPLAHLAAGNRMEALEEFEQLARDDFAGVPRDMFWFAATCVLAETCSLLGDRPRAHRLYELLLPYRDRNVMATQAACLGSCERFLGLLATTMGEDWDAAEAHFEAALAEDAASSRARLPVTRRDYAEMLLARRGQGDLERAAELLRDTLDAAGAAGMARLATSVRARIEEIERELDPSWDAPHSRAALSGPAPRVAQLG